MATTSYSVLPFITPLSHTNQSDPYQRRNQDFYGSNIQTSTVHPYQTTYASHIPERQRPNYSQNYESTSNQPTIVHSDPQHQSSTGFGQNNALATNHQKPPTNNNAGDPQTIKRSTTQPTSTKNQAQQQRSKSPPIRSERQISQNQPTQIQTKTNHNKKRTPRNSSPPGGQQMSTIHSEASRKGAASNQPLKENKSSTIRAAAIKKIEAERERKRNDAFFPTSQNKPKAKTTTKSVATTPESDNDDDEDDGRRTRTKAKLNRSRSFVQPPYTDDERSDSEKTKGKPKHIHSVPQAHHHHHHHHNHDHDHNEHGKGKQKAKQSQSLTRVQQRDNERSESEKSKVKQKKGNASKKSHEKHDSDGDVSDKEKTKKHQARRSRQKQNNESSDDEQHHRSKSRKRNVNSDSNINFPPIRRHRATEGQRDLARHGRNPYYDEYYAPYEGIPTQFQFHRHLYEDASNIPPYLAPYHNAYDPFFDYEKRKKFIKNRREKNQSRTDPDDDENGNGDESERENRTRSQQSRKSQTDVQKKKSKGRKSRSDSQTRKKNHVAPPYYPDDDVLDLWRQERNDYLKKKFKPTVHDVLYAQQWMKADSYVENQRRRHLRDSQGFYFPYKKYTLQDYKEIQKLTAIANPYGDGTEPIPDRKERARKRQEYGQQVERNTIDNPGIRHIEPRDAAERPPWHVNNAETPNSDRVSKRGRALDYAREQVKYRPINGSQQSPYKTDDGYQQGRSRQTNNHPDQSYDYSPRGGYESYGDDRQ